MGSLYCDLSATPWRQSSELLIQCTIQIQHNYGNQDRAFLNLISMGLSGKLGSNGFIYAMPLPMIVCLGVNDVLFGRIVRDTIPVFPGSIHILFLTVNGIEICWRYNLCEA